MARSRFESLGLRVHMEGLEDLKKNVEKLKSDVRKKVLGVSIAAGAKVIRDEARNNHKWISRNGPDGLEGAIKHRRSWKESRQDYEVRQVGVFKIRGAKKYAKTKKNVRLGRAGKEYDIDPPEYYWRFLEFGTVRGIGKNEFSFLRPAFNARKQDAANRTVDELRRRLDKAVNNLPKKPKRSRA